jgi:hypothetical protein
MARNFKPKGGDVSGIGIDGAELNREFSRVLNELSKFAHAIDARDLGQTTTRRNAYHARRDEGGN